jgi:hypothetical protein
MVRHWRLGLVALLGACTFGETVIAPTAPTVVVHAVLNPTASGVDVLVEETLTGRVTIDTTLAYNPDDPIRSAGGIPIGGARVVVERLDAPADSVVLGERFAVGVTPRRSTGVYTFRNSSRVALSGDPGFGFPPLPLVPGGRYRLRVRTLDGRTVEGETRIPGPVPNWNAFFGTDAVADTLDRVRDTLRLSWPSIPGGRTAGVRVDTPRGPWFLFNDSSSFAFAGTLRNFFQDGLPSVFQPGHVQQVSVAVVDTNFYDYYRSGNDPFGGSGLINKLRGGIGVFGSTVPMVRRRITVTQPAAAPLDAWWRAPEDSMALWLETPGPSVSAVSGWFRDPNCAGECNIGGLGTLRNGELRFVVSAGSGDTSGVFTGRVFADSIVGTWRPGASAVRFLVISGPRVYRRRGPPLPPPLLR